MRFAFVYIPRYPCAVEMQRNPRLADAPLIIGDAEQPRRVLDCSPAAGALGVRAGMPIRKALSHCPDAAVLPPDPVLYRGLWETTLDALGEITPEIEDQEMGRAYLNVNGLQLHYRDDDALATTILETIRQASGLTASIGIAGGKFPAFAAAITAPPGQRRIVSPGTEAEFLAPLEVDLLPVEPESIFRLRLLGLEEIGDVFPLSIADLQGQFGFEGKRLWQLAHGIDDEALSARPHSEVLQTAITLEAPVASIEVIIAIARQLLSRLRLPLRGRAARRLTLQAELTSGRGWERRVVLREAVSEDARLDFLLRASLTNFPPPQAIRNLCLRLDGLTGETGKQLSLGERGRVQRQLEEAIRQLKARYGHSPIYRCVDVEPWSSIPEERQILVESDG